MGEQENTSTAGVAGGVEGHADGQLGIVRRWVRGACGGSLHGQLHEIADLHAVDENLLTSSAYNPQNRAKGVIGNAVGKKNMHGKGHMCCKRRHEGWISRVRTVHSSSDGSKLMHI